MYKRHRKHDKSGAVYLLGTLLFITISWSPSSWGLPNGAPETVCDTMLPFHGGGIPAQSTAPPFEVVTSALTIGQGQTLRVDILGASEGLSFGGFLIMARSSTPPYQTIGQFNQPAATVAKLINCDSSVNNAATHINTNPKTAMTLEWQAPVDFLGDVVFNATVAQSYNSFWVGIQSEPVQVVSSGQATRDVFYNDCGLSKNCFGYPENCINTQSCEAMVSVKSNGQNYEFEMQSNAAGAAYVAVGLSTDARMGDDLVTECVPENGQVNIYSSYTSNSPYGVSRTGVPQNSAQLLESSSTNGKIYCRVQRSVLTTVQNQNFDLINNRYHVMVAHGSSLKENGAGYHDLGRLASGGPINLAEISPQNTWTSTTRQSFVPQPTSTPNTAPATGDVFYSECGRSKTCFGLPDNCVNTQNCDAMVSVKVRGQTYEFEMQSNTAGAAYAAVGLSTDARMGDDLVTECVPENGQVNIYSSYTSNAPYGVTRTGVPQNSAQLLEGSFNNGKIYCRVQRSVMTTVQNDNFDLINDRYHLLVAHGSSIGDNGVGYHDLGRLAAGNPINLAEVTSLGGASMLLVRLHGAFMITAWIGTTSLGILLARYFKQTWTGSQLCGKDQWFAWHRICMVTTWTLTMVAFVLIFVELGAWSAEQNPHAILGLVTTILCFIQPIGAIFRPAPNSKNRPIFNWLHWLIGNVAHILAIVTIFFAVQLTKAQIPQWVDWILVAYVCVHVVVHLIYSLAGCASDRQQAQRINTFQMGDMPGHHHPPGMRNGMKTERRMDSPYASMRKGLLGVYICVLLGFVVVLILIVVLAPIETFFNNLQS